MNKDTVLAFLLLPRNPSIGTFNVDSFFYFYGGKSSLVIVKYSSFICDSSSFLSEQVFSISPTFSLDCLSQPLLRLSELSTLHPLPDRPMHNTLPEKTPASHSLRSDFQDNHCHKTDPE